MSSASPAGQQNIPATSPSPAAPLSPSSSNVSVRKKIVSLFIRFSTFSFSLFIDVIRTDFCSFFFWMQKPNGQKRPPAKSPPKASSSNPEELEIEIAEVLYGLMTQSQGPSKKESVPNDSREVNNRSRVSSPASNSNSSATPLSAVGEHDKVPIFAIGICKNQKEKNLISSLCSSVLMSIFLVSVAPKRKRPRQVLENPGGFGVRSSPISSSTAKVEIDQTTMKMEVFSPNLEKTPQFAAENVVSLYDLSASAQSLPAAADPTPEPMKMESEVKRRPEESEFMESKEEVNSPKRESFTVGAADNSIREDAAVAVTQV